MATTRRTKNKNIQNKIGVAPTTSQKLLYVASKLNLDISGMQGSSVNLFDTLPLVSTTGRQTLSFFSNSQKKSLNFSNFQNGTLGAGETMVIEKVKFMLLQLSAGADLTNDSTQIINAWPLASLPDTGIVQFRTTFKFGTINVVIANTTTTKEYQVNEIDPSLNRMTSGISVAQVGDAAVGTINVGAILGNNTIILDAPPVVPMNQKFQIQYSFGPLGTLAPNLAIMCTVGDFGSIYAAKTTL